MEIGGNIVMTELIQHIMETVDKKCVQSNCRRILKKCSFKSGKDLNNITELAVWLYVYGFCKEAIAVCDIVKDIPFTGNYTLWDNVDTALCLKARILREQGNNIKSSEIVDLVNEHRHPELYGNGVGWFTETLDKNIKSNLEDNFKSGAREWRMIKLEKAISYREAGGYPLSDGYLEDVIKEMIDILSTEQ